MAVVQEWTRKQIYLLAGLHHICVFKKHSGAQMAARREKRSRADAQRATTAARLRRLRKRAHMTTMRQRHARAACRKRKRGERALARQAKKYSTKTNTKLIDLRDRESLFKRIERGDIPIQTMLEIVDFYIPGTLLSREIDVMQWTTQLCRHVHSALK
jgi:hypothetical protein